MLTLIEAQKIYSGVTSKTTAHITTQQGHIYYDLFVKKGLKWAQLYYRSQQQALKAYKELIEKEDINCDFKIVKNYYFSNKKTTKLYKILNKIGANVNYLGRKTIFGINATSVIEAKGQAIFHPLKFLSELKKDFEIFENTRILKIDMNNKILYADKFYVKAKRIIIATNYPIVKVKGLYFIKLYKSHSYCVSTKNIGNINGTYHSNLENGLTFRNYNNKIIIGGLDHRTGRVNYTDKKQRFIEIAKKHFNSKIEYFWDANDVVTYDGLPLVGQFNKRFKDIYIITGFNKWGMTNSMASAKLITDLISNKQNEFEKVFSPQRFTFKFSNFFITLGVSIFNLVIRPLTPSFLYYKRLKKGNGRIMNYKGSKKAIYRDESGRFHVCNPYCKHLGCQLRFNKNSKTWDCPCHGSRYDIDGNIITAPTVFNLDKLN